MMQRSYIGFLCLLVVLSIGFFYGVNEMILEWRFASMYQETVRDEKLRPDVRSVQPYEVDQALRNAEQLMHPEPEKEVEVMDVPQDVLHPDEHAVHAYDQTEVLYFRDDVRRREIERSYSNSAWLRTEEGRALTPSQQLSINEMQRHLILSVQQATNAPGMLKD